MPKPLDNPFVTIDAPYLLALHREIALEQVRHPLDEYRPGSPRLERLYQAMLDAQRFQWPESWDVNV